MKKEYC